jgi:hypothetical protein
MVRIGLCRLVVLPVVKRTCTSPLDPPRPDINVTHHTGREVATETTRRTHPQIRHTNGPVLPGQAILIEVSIQRGDPQHRTLLDRPYALSSLKSVLATIRSSVPWPSSNDS